MKHPLTLITALLLVPFATMHAAAAPKKAPPAPEKAAAAPVRKPAAEMMRIAADSPAFVFSPGNWIGDDGRTGKRFRQTWNPGAYFRVTWDTTSFVPAAVLDLDTSTLPSNLKPPLIVYNIDGVWKSQIPCASEIVIEGIKGAGRHELSVYLQKSEQKERWGSEGKSGLNVLRVTGLEVDAGSTPVAAERASRWALIVGDSITEGVGATELSAYSHLVGQALRTQGYEYGISASGWSGWLRRGDIPPGDIPGYYVVTGSTNGEGGTYDEANSRWNKLDGNAHSLLDSQRRISAYGRPGEEPALIMINYGTNDALGRSNPSDTFASIVQCLAALRRSAPEAQIVLIIPFGQSFAQELKAAVEVHKNNHPSESKVSVIDLSPSVARTLSVKEGLMGGLHPNDRGHATFAAAIIPQVMRLLLSASK